MSPRHGTPRRGAGSDSGSPGRIRVAPGARQHPFESAHNTPFHVTRCVIAPTTSPPRLPSFPLLVPPSPHLSHGPWSAAYPWRRGSWKSSAYQLPCWLAVCSPFYGAQRGGDADGLAPVRCGWPVVLCWRDSRWICAQRVGRPWSRLCPRWSCYGPWPRAGRLRWLCVHARARGDLHCWPFVCVRWCRGAWLSFQRCGAC